jgi:RNA polymerase-binding transcription factor DksA
MRNSICAWLAALGRSLLEENTMDRKKADKFRVALTALQQRLRDDGSKVTDEALDSVNGELSHVPMHLGDLGSEEFSRDMSAVLAENEGYLAGEVRDAIARFDAGKYGECENCGKGITLARLEAIPFARHCVKCAEKLQGPREEDYSGANRLGPNFNTGRPRGPDDTLAPEGLMAEDRRRRGRRGDVHAVGDAGGGTAWGGLAGSTIGHGDPSIANLQDAAGSGNSDAAEERFASRAHTVQPVGYESDEDRQRYAEEEDQEEL